MTQLNFAPPKLNIIEQKAFRLRNRETLHSQITKRSCWMKMLSMSLSSIF